MPVLVIEGRRGTGKTTVVDALCSKRAFVQRAKWPRGAEPWSDMAEQLKEMNGSGYVWVVDRFHVTEFVMRQYEAVMDDVANDDVGKSGSAQAFYEVTRAPRLRRIQADIEDAGGIVVFLDASNETIAQRMAKAEREPEVEHPYVLAAVWRQTMFELGGPCLINENRRLSLTVSILLALVDRMFTLAVEGRRAKLSGVEGTWTITDEAATLGLDPTAMIAEHLVERHRKRKEAEK